MYICHKIKERNTVQVDNRETADYTVHYFLSYFVPRNFMCSQKEILCLVAIDLYATYKKFFVKFNV